MMTLEENHENGIEPGENNGAQEAPLETEPSDSDWKAEAEKYKDMFIRGQAEAENMKKRLEREKSDFVKFANENLIKELLPVLDNLERALAHSRENCGSEDSLAQGVKLTVDGFLNALDKFGVTMVKTKGEPFDPNFHEAVMQQENPDVEPNTVLEEVQKGYLLHDRLIRPAMVVVSR
jgi:molecular chaperone GrpE